MLMEFIDVYDNLGQKQGLVVEKNEAHEKGMIHRGICVWIINDQDEILLQKRSRQVMFPELWDISFSGHIQAGETSVEAAIREGYEEIGIHIEPQRLQYLFTCREYGEIEGYFEDEIDDVFLYRANFALEDYTFCDHEVDEVAYIPLDTFKKMVATKDERLLAYENHYLFLLAALKSQLVTKGGGR